TLLAGALRLRMARRPWRTLLRGSLLLLIGTPLLRPLIARALFTWRARRPFGPRWNSGERNAAARLIDVNHPNLQHVADTDDFVRVPNEAVSEPANVHQAAVGEPDIDEYAEIDHVQHGA